jgi:hypothetical protein
LLPKAAPPVTAGRLEEDEVIAEAGGLGRQRTLPDE